MSFLRDLKTLIMQNKRFSGIPLPTNIYRAVKHLAETRGPQAALVAVVQPSLLLRKTHRRSVDELGEIWSVRCTKWQSSYRSALKRSWRCPVTRWPVITTNGWSGCRCWLVQCAFHWREFHCWAATPSPRSPPIARKRPVEYFGCENLRLESFSGQGNGWAWNLPHWKYAASLHWKKHEDQCRQLLAMDFTGRLPKKLGFNESARPIRSTLQSPSMKNCSQAFGVRTFGGRTRRNKKPQLHDATVYAGMILRGRGVQEPLVIFVSDVVNVLKSKGKLLKILLFKIMELFTHPIIECAEKSFGSIYRVWLFSKQKK